MNQRIKKIIMSVYSVFLLITLGFAGTLIYEGVFDIGGVEAATIYVGPGQTYSTIGAAISAANLGDTIRVFAGTYNENVVISKRLSLVGNSSADTIINGGGSGIVVVVNTNLINVRNFKIINSGSTGTGIYLNGVSSCQINDNNCSGNYIGVYLTSSSSNTVYNNMVTSNTWGIYLQTSTSNTIRNNICSSNTQDGIGLNAANSNTFHNNSCYSNSDDGMQIHASSSNIIKDNICRSNSDDGIYLFNSSNSNNLYKNLCNLNGYDGISLYTSSSNTIKDNNLTSNIDDSIQLRSSTSNKVINNICNSNIQDGIILDTASDSNTISRNICNSNRDGIHLTDSKWNIVDNNTCNSNRDDSISLYTASHNVISNNSCKSSNDKGIVLELNCNKTIIKENTCSLNVNDGIWLYSSFGCIISNNTCSNNGYGIYFGSSRGNYIFHNRFISNSQQARDDTVNNWNNSHQEGNYWSDYTGVDNGANGRIAGDGIGDTQIPHPGTGFDNYPFTTDRGWLYPGIPQLFDPGEIDVDGNYTVSWNNTRATVGYILEEDITNSFNSPVELYNGSELSFDLQLRPNGTYHYRVKGYNNFHESKWSNIEEITVDWPPSAPTQLTAKNATGHNITLSWEANPEMDIEGYHILINDSDADEGGPFHWLETVTNSETEHMVTGLSEETECYFVLMAYDGLLSNSTFSNVAGATTTDETPPEAPTDLVAAVSEGTNITLKWQANTEADLAGYIIYMNDTNNGPTGDFHIIDIIYGTEMSYLVTGGSEETTYYFKLKAFDEVPNNSSFSDIASATTHDITVPVAPMGLSVSNPTSCSLTVSWDANIEPDVIGYNLSRSVSIEGPFNVINNEPITETQFIDVDLQEITTYYYKLQAIDNFNLKSGFSEVAFGTTLIGPRPPEINNTINDFKIPEDCCDDSSINLLYWFKDVNNDTLKFQCSGEKHINVTIFDQNGTVILIPEKDWNGKETITFSADDGNSNVTFDTVTITVTPVNDPPGTPVIKTPRNHAQIEYGDTLNFDATCSDPDIIYGDKLTFTWSSNISGKIEVGSSFRDVVLPVGYHMITLNISDTEGEASTATLFISVIETPETDTDDDGMPNIWERENGLDPSDPKDASEDSDNDGVTNIDEFHNNTNPLEPETIPDKDKDKDKDKELESDESDRAGEIPLIWIMIIIILIIIIVIIVLGFSIYIRKKKREFEGRELLEPEKIETRVEAEPIVSPRTRGQDIVQEVIQPQVIQTTPVTITPEITETYIAPAEFSTTQPLKELQPIEQQPSMLPPAPPMPIQQTTLEPTQLHMEVVLEPPQTFVEAMPEPTQPQVEATLEPTQHEIEMELTLQEKLDMIEEQLLFGDISEETYLKLKNAYEMER